MASIKQIREFREKCLLVLDSQVFELSTPEAKISAIQAVMRVLREIRVSEGDDVIMELISYPRRIENPVIDEIISEESENIFGLGA